MPWVVSNSGGSGYAWSGLNTYNQHAAAISLPSNCTVTKLRVVAAGYNTGTVSTRLALWSVGGSAQIQSSTFSMADGNESTQYTYERTVSPKTLSSGTYWVGLYRAPNESHIMQTTSGSGNGYRKTNTASFPSIGSMSGYNTDSNDEPTVGAFYITQPNTPSGLSVSRSSDTTQNLSVFISASADKPVNTVYIERYDNISGSWYLIKTLSSTYTTTSYTLNYSDSTTSSNKYYKYRCRTKNDDGYSAYSNEDDINTTPSAPTSVAAVRSGTNIVISWSNPARNEDALTIQRRTSTDGVSWTSYSTLSSSLATNATTYTDTSPANYNQYQVRADTITPNALHSSYTVSNQIVILQPPDAPSGLIPDALYFDADDTYEFKWNFNTVDSSDQTQYSLRYRIQGDAWPTTPQENEVYSSSKSSFMTGGTFLNEELYEWQVKTWGAATTGGTYSDGSSDWSNIATFRTSPKPVATVTNPVSTSSYGYSELTIAWIYTQEEYRNQTAVEANLYNSNMDLLENKEIASSKAYGDSDSLTFNTLLENNTEYNISIRVNCDWDIWSEWVNVNFTTEFLEPKQPTFTLNLNEDSGSVDVNIVNPDINDQSTINSTQDSYITEVYPDTNYNDNGYLFVRNTAGSIKHIFLDFDLSEFSGKIISNATLTLHRRSTLTTGIYSCVRQIETAFNESTLTYNSIYSLDSVEYDDHEHTVGDTETWNVTDLVQNYANGSILDYNGMAIVATNIGAAEDQFYDSTNIGYEPQLSVEYTENIETSYNKVYRSIDDGEFMLIADNVEPNSIVTDYIPTIGGNNNYYVSAIGESTGIKDSEQVDIDILLSGMFFINGGNSMSDYVRLVGDVSINESISRDQVIKKYEGREYPLKYQGNSLDQTLSFSCDLPVEKYNDLVSLILNVGDIMYRDWRGRWFYAYLSNPRFDTKSPQAYQFSCNITRLNSGVE